MSWVTYKGAVYPWQCDHIGHMNVMWYVGKFDEANWNFLATLGLTPTYFAEQHRGMAAVGTGQLGYPRPHRPSLALRVSWVLPG